MAKIPKNRQDSEMLGNWLEKESFEHLSDGTTAEPAPRPAKSEPKKPAYADYFTPELTEELGKALLALKVKLYKEGIVDYALKVSSDADQIVLKAIPSNKPPKQR